MQGAQDTRRTRSARTGRGHSRKGVQGLKDGLRGSKSARTAVKEGRKGAYDRVRSRIKGCGGPVDVATGQVFLEETDLSLPGTLPLDFTRRVASGYRSGGWFGPMWTSTIDQRLEVDGDGVVFVTEDGMLLTYPHPAGSTATPAELVLPESGPRWPLKRLADGGYRITDPVTGIARRFTAPREDDGVALLTMVSDRNRNTVDFDYDTEGTPRAILHSGGYYVMLTVEDRRVTLLSVAGAAADGSGDDLVVKRYGYTDGNLTAVTDSSGLPTRFTYDERLRLTAWEDTNNSRSTYAYDDRDRCVARRGMTGHMAHTFTYDVPDPARPGCRVTEVTTAEGATSRFTVDDHCLVVAETDPLGGTVTTTYDALHHVAATTDQLGHTTAYVNNELGLPTRVTRPDGAVLRVTYNDLNLKTAVDLPDGTKWQYTYDERGNCTSVTEPSGVTVHHAYTPAGHPLSVTDEAGHTTTVRCDGAGLPLKVTDPLGAVTVWQRDALGRPTALTDPLRHTTHLAWSPEGRLVRRTAPDGAVESWTYDGEGNCVAHTDQLGQVTSFEYTHFDLLAARVGADGTRHHFDYDASLRLTRVDNPRGMSWTYRHDAAGRVTAETDFDGRTLSYAYDAAGRLVRRTSADGESISFSHDALGRLVRKESAEAVTTFVYDLLGNLVEAVRPDCGLTLERDGSGRLLAETVDGRGPLTYAYDEAGRRTGRTTPTGATSSWEYDAAGRRTRLTTSGGGTVEFERDAAGREVKRRVGTDARVTLERAYDEVGRLTAQTVTAPDGSPVQHRTYTYRADGAVTALGDQLSGGRHFDRDPAGRVTAVYAHNWTETYAYDAAGNQTYAAWPDIHPGHESTGPREYTGTLLTRAGSTRYEHDALGRVVLRRKAGQCWRYTWDAEDRLTSVVTPDGTRWLYTYDPLGRRITKQRLAPGDDKDTVDERTDFTWDGTTLCEQTTTARNLPRPVSLTWDHEGGQPLAQTERIHSVDSRSFTFVTDLTGTPTELVDDRGTVTWRTRSTHWGTTAWPANSTAYTPLRAPGQYFDPETGLHCDGFRYYDPETGRHLSCSGT
ncbi:type IV secretion protein Rhs [Streptomyces venezuelae]|uniref:Type IV secretion protein Rhs n=1 Tax=Streptomyces venezuelae TaxID=54571 RepID=A0A5P2BEB3_STRVZ|nr:type IV secretion protein Rhs [Streptomyces venezuelae]